MFLLFDLVLLSVVAGIVWLIAGLADLVVVYKPLWEYRRKNVR
jgi:hypothetical protein